MRHVDQREDALAYREGKKVCNYPYCINLAKVRGKCRRHDKQTRNGSAEDAAAVEMNQETTAVLGASIMEGTTLASAP